MTTTDRYPIIVLERITVKDGLSPDGRTTLNRRQKVGHKVPEFKNGSHLSHPLKERPNEELENSSIRCVESEPGTPESDQSSVSVVPSVSTDLVAKVKVENDEESAVTQELVPYWGSKSEGEALKSENDSEDSSDESSSDDGMEFYCNTAARNHSVHNKSVSKKAFQKSKTHHDSRGIKLVDVSVKLADLFSINDRRLGKAHSNNRACTCMYCCDEYRSVHNLEPASKNLDIDEGLTRAESSEKLRRSCVLKAHPRTKRVRPLLLQCEKCPRKCRDRRALKEHMRVHSGERPYKCDLCSASFKQRGTVIFHIRQVHSDERPFKCKICSASFKVNTTLRLHMKNKHSNERPFTCNLCSATFKMKSILHTHMLVHSNESPFKCSFCSASFKLNGNLRTHLRVHTGERPFKCDICFAGFKQSGTLKEHIRLVHSNERPFSCKLCSALFKLKCNLKSHVKSVHSDKRPFKCNLCPASFKQNGNLKEHLKFLHSDKKSFTCGHCSVSFRWKSSLIAHILSHSDERPFSCDLCASSFKQKRFLKNHIKSVHST